MNTHAIAIDFNGDWEIMEEFSLSPESARIMFSCQYHLVLSDINEESNYEKKLVKKEWLSEWKNLIETFLGNQANLVMDLSALLSLIEKVKQKEKYELTPHLILLEITLFKPYFPIGSTGDSSFKHLKVADEKLFLVKNKYFATAFGIKEDVVDRYKENFKIAIDGIRGKEANPLTRGLVGAVALAVVAALAAPLAASLLAPILAPGLYGAAAVSSVLAALGGVLAAGELGMAGGFAVVVGGGAILGAGAGVGMGNLLAQSPEATLELLAEEAAKVEAMVKEIILVWQNFSLSQKIVKDQRDAISTLEDQLCNLLLDKGKNEKEINSFKKAIDSLRRAQERNQNLISSCDE